MNTKSLIFSKRLIEDALFSLRFLIAINQFVTRQFFNSWFDNFFDINRDREIKVLLAKNFIGKLKRHEDKRCVFYFITYRGRQFLANQGDKKQEKYLNIQNA